MTNRNKFFIDVHNYFGGLNQKQVDGFNSILDEWDRRAQVDIEWRGKQAQPTDYAVGTPTGAAPIPSAPIPSTGVVQKGQMADPQIKSGESGESGPAKGTGSDTPAQAAAKARIAAANRINSGSQDAGATDIADAPSPENFVSDSSANPYRLDGLGTGPERTQPDDRTLAYIIATVWHETMTTMQPIREMGSEAYLKAKKYYPWVGGGYAQISWEANYKKFGLSAPADALDPKKAMDVLFRGMLLGMFRGHRVQDYFDATHNDPVGARDVVNAGGDKATLIAGYYYQFLKAIS